jgi:hypothetical protein
MKVFMFLAPLIHHSGVLGTANGFECRGHSLAALLASEVGHKFGKI